MLEHGVTYARGKISCILSRPLSPSFSKQSVVKVSVYKNWVHEN